MSRLIVEFCGEEYSLSPGDVFTMGREGDLVVDDANPFLHRNLAELRHDHGFWWLANVGSRLSVTVTGEAGTLQSVVGPGSRVPVVMSDQAVLFTAGETTYELNLHTDAPVYDEARPAGDPEGTAERTLGAVTLSPGQFRLILVLAEDTLRRTGTGVSEMPSSARAAERLGWTVTAFNRKLDNVCEKFARAGVKGLLGGHDKVASNRRARLVEHAVAAKIVRAEHLELLDLPDGATA